VGQQQLLLIVIAIIIIGISITIANQLFDVNEENTYKDSITYELINLGSMAQHYFNKPIQMMGGNKSFAGWEIPSELDTTMCGYYYISTSSDNQIIIEGHPFTEKGYAWNMKGTISSTNIVIIEIPN